MKFSIGVFFVGAIIGLPPFLLAEEGKGYTPSPLSVEETYVEQRVPAEGEEERIPPPPGEGLFHKHRRRRGVFLRGLKTRQFREELRALGEKIIRNRDLIKSLEAEIGEMPPGLERAEVRRRRAEAQRRQVELELELAQRRVEITRRARDIAQQRYDEARLELEKVTRRIKKNYPDLIPPKNFPPENF